MPKYSRRKSKKSLRRGKKTLRNRNRKSRSRSRTRSRKSRKMSGGLGDFYQPSQINQLQSNGFSQYDIEQLENIRIPFADILDRMHHVMNQGDNGFNGNADDFVNVVVESLVADNSPAPPDSQSSYEDAGPMHISELQTADESEGMTDNEFDGGKKSKQRGGTCYGRGVGANSLDPNYSIYNTKMLSLFPYK